MRARFGFAHSSSVNVRSAARSGRLVCELPAAFVMPFMMEQACADQTGTSTVGMRAFARAASPAGVAAKAGRTRFTEPQSSLPSLCRRQAED